MSNDLKVALIALYDWNALGIRTLHAVLEQNNINTTSIFFKLQNPNNTVNEATADDVNALMALLKRTQPGLVAISLTSAMFKVASRITESVKKELGSPVLWGGIHPTIRPEQCLEHADMVCIGEGERLVLELCKRLSEGAKYDDIGNLWVKENGSIIKNELKPLVDDLDSVPFVDFSNKDKYLVDRGKILNLPSLDERAEYSIMTARGCPFTCSYCCNNMYVRLYKGLGKYVRRRSVENVMEELLLAKETQKNLSYIYFYDDVFTLDKKWLKEFSPRYIKSIGLPFFCYTHPNCADEETISILKDMGLRDATMGIQSGSKFVRETYFKRRSSNGKIVELARLFNRYGINPSYDILLDNPFEDDNNRNETLQLLLEFPRPFQLHTHSLAFFPEAELTKMALGRGFINEEDVEDQKQKSVHRWTPTLDLSRDKTNLFWDNLYYMAKKKYFSKRLIRALSKSTFLKRHPEMLTLFLRTCTYDIHSASTGRFKIVYLAVNALKMIFSGDFQRFKIHFKMYLQRTFG